MVINKYAERFFIMQLQLLKRAFALTICLISNSTIAMEEEISVHEMLNRDKIWGEPISRMDKILLEEDIWGGYTLPVEDIRKDYVQPTISIFTQEIGKVEVRQEGPGEKQNPTDFLEFFGLESLRMADQDAYNLMNPSLHFDMIRKQLGITLTTPFPERVANEIPLEETVWYLSKLLSGGKSSHVKVIVDVMSNERAISALKVLEDYVNIRMKQKWRLEKKYSIDLLPHVFDQSLYNNNGVYRNICDSLRRVKILEKAIQQCKYGS